MAEKKVIEIVDKAVRIITQKIQYATSTLAGILKLTGDLGGTYDNPYVVNTHLTNPLPLSQGGTGSDLEFSGPGVLIQTGSSQPVTVEDPLSPGRGGTGKSNVGKINMPEDGTPINLEGDGTWDNSEYIPYFISKYKLDKWQHRDNMLRKTATLPSDEILQANGNEIDTSTGINKSDLGRLSQVNTWIAAQYFGSGASGGQVAIKAASAGTEALVVDTAPSPSVHAAEFKYGGNTHIKIMPWGNRANVIEVGPFDNGANAGNRIVLYNNNNSTTPAAAFISLADKGGTLYRLWPDDSGVLRIGTSNPTNTNDTSGTVVGTQTSFADSKLLDAPDSTPTESLHHVVRAARDALRSFRYRSGMFNGERFPIGLVIDYAPRYGMDRDKEHPQGKSLNIITALGDLFNSIVALDERLKKLENSDD